MKSKETIEAANSEKFSQNSDRSIANHSESDKAAARARRLANLRPFQPGQSGNPGGRPKRDASAEIARQAFENNEELIYEAYVDALSKGSGFVFQVLSDRAYGKLKDSMDVDVNLGDEIVRRIIAGRARLAK